MRPDPAFSFLLLVLTSPCTATNQINSLFSTSERYDQYEILRRNEDIASRLAQTPIHGVRKMSTDEGEKFFLDYWSFVDETQGCLSERDMVDANDERQHQYDSVDREMYHSSNLFHPRSFPFQPSFGWEAAAVANSNSNSSPWIGRILLEQRDFRCPSGTQACTSIGRSDRCCSTGDTCELVTDTGSGDVGCCPNGETCSGVVGSCPSQYTTCSSALGGGCCIPGYECVSGGCKFSTFSQPPFFILVVVWFGSNSIFTLCRLTLLTQAHLSLWLQSQ